MSEFADFWKALHPSAKPVSWLMREADVPHWIRFHSLPFSKQYADTEEEYSILLGRQNALASAVLGEDSHCWMVQACWTTPEGFIEVTDESVMFQATDEFRLKYAFSFEDDQGDDISPVPWNVMAALVRWRQGGFDKVLLRIVDEQATPVIWASAESGAVFAPYDGGVDLFLPSEAIAQELRSKYADWLPSHPDGL